MTQLHNDLLSLINQYGSQDILKRLFSSLLDTLMEADVSIKIQAQLSERSDSRQTYRNGYRERTLETRAGTLQLAIPKLREGTYYPPFLERYQRIEKALIGVVQEAYIQGVSARKMQHLAQQMGLGGYEQISGLRDLREPEPGSRGVSPSAH